MPRIEGTNWHGFGVARRNFDCNNVEFRGDYGAWGNELRSSSALTEGPLYGLGV